MSPKDFDAALRALARLMKAAGGEAAGANVERLAGIFSASPEKTTAATLKKLSSLETGGDGQSALAAILRETENFAKSIAGTKFAALVSSLSVVLDRNGTAGIANFADAAVAHLRAPKKTSKSGAEKQPAEPRNDIVRQYAKRLEDCLGDEGFVAAYRQLEDDKTTSPAEVIAIAKMFTVERPRSRPKALHAIWQRHHNLMGFRDKSASRAGRSAA
ncbi:MAG: hypothetical protein ACREC6_06570 [Hyphomicrobiaceae bacterium]